MKVMSMASSRMIRRCGLWKASGGTSMSAARSPSEIGKSVAATPRRTCRYSCMQAGAPRRR